MRRRNYWKRIPAPTPEEQALLILSGLLITNRSKYIREHKVWQYGAVTIVKPRRYPSLTLWYRWEKPK